MHAQKQHRNTHQGSVMGWGSDQRQYAAQNCDCVIRDYRTSTAGLDLCAVQALLSPVSPCLAVAVLTS